MDEYFLGAIVAAGKGGTQQPGAEGRPTCGLYEDCIAPLCPLDQSSLKGIWYPGEEICRSRTHGNLPWIKAQRKIGRAKATGCFNLEILNSIRTIRKGITGLDPNADEKPQLRRWIELHKKKRSSGGRTYAVPVREEAKAAKKKNPFKGHTGHPSSRGLAGPPGVLSPRRLADPQTGVSAPLKNVSKPGGQRKNLCRNGVSQHPSRTGTGKPPSGRSALKTGPPREARKTG